MVDDPRANITQWGPLRPGGSNFTTHRLNEHPQGLEYRKNFKLMLFGALFALLGLGVSTRGVISGERFAGLFGLIFLTVGVWVLWPTSVLFHRELRSVTLKGRTVRSAAFSRCSSSPSASMAATAPTTTAAS